MSKNNLKKNNMSKVKDLNLKHKDKRGRKKYNMRINKNKSNNKSKIKRMESTMNC